jgi:hypothetical protein
MHAIHVYLVSSMLRVCIFLGTIPMPLLGRSTWSTRLAGVAGVVGEVVAAGSNTLRCSRRRCGAGNAGGQPPPLRLAALLAACDAATFPPWGCSDHGTSCICFWFRLPLLSTARCSSAHIVSAECCADVSGLPAFSRKAPRLSFPHHVSAGFSSSRVLELMSMICTHTHAWLCWLGATVGAEHCNEAAVCTCKLNIGGKSSAALSE